MPHAEKKKKIKETRRLQGQNPDGVGRGGITKVTDDLRKQFQLTEKESIGLWCIKVVLFPPSGTVTVCAVKN